MKRLAVDIFLQKLWGRFDTGNWITLPWNSTQKKRWIYVPRQEKIALIVHEKGIFYVFFFFYQSHFSSAVTSTCKPWCRSRSEAAVGSRFFSTFLTLLSALIKKGEKMTNCKLLCGRKKKEKQEENVSGWKKPFIRRLGVNPETLETS